MLRYNFALLLVDDAALEVMWHWYDARVSAQFVGPNEVESSMILISLVIIKKSLQ